MISSLKYKWPPQGKKPHFSLLKVHDLITVFRIVFGFYVVFALLDTSEKLKVHNTGLHNKLNTREEKKKKKKKKNSFQVCLTFGLMDIKSYRFLSHNSLVSTS